MNIKISKRRAQQILAEEVEKFLNENQDVDPKVLREHVVRLLKGEQK